MEFRVLVVEDGDLPSSTDWVIVRTYEDVTLFVKRGRSTWDGGLEGVLTGAWAASAKFQAGGRPLLRAV